MKRHLLFARSSVLYLGDRRRTISAVTYSRSRVVLSSSMSSQPTSEKPRETEAPNDYPEGGLRAWGVASGAAGVFFCTMGYINSWGVYQAYYETHQLADQSPSAISWIGSLQSFFIFGAALVGGPLFDRYGAKVIYPAAIVYTFTIFMTSLCTEYYQFMLAQGVLGGISNGLAMAPAMAAPPQYFNKKRGAAMGMTIAGSSIGGVILPITLNQLLTQTNLGFAWSVRIVAFLILGIFLLSCPPIRARLPPRDSHFFLPQAFKQASYVSLIGCAFLMFLGMFPPLFYIPSFAISQGMSPTLAFYLVSILNAASFFGRVIPAVLSDRFGKLNTVAAAGISSGILGLCWQRVEGNAGIIVFVAFFGFCSGAIISGASVSLASTTPDPKNIGTYMGMGMGLISIAPLISPPIAGALYDNALSFTPVSTFSGTFSLVGGLLVMVLVKPLNGYKIFSMT